MAAKSETSATGARRKDQAHSPTFGEDLAAVTDSRLRHLRVQLLRALWAAPRLGDSRLTASRFPVTVPGRPGRPGWSRVATSHPLPGGIGERVAGIDEIGGARRMRHPQAGVFEGRAHPERLEHPR